MIINKTFEALNHIHFAIENFTAADNYICQMIEKGDVDVNSELTECELYLEDANRLRKSIQDKINKLKEINKFRLDYLNKLKVGNVK